MNSTCETIAEPRVLYQRTLTTSVRSRYAAFVSGAGHAPTRTTRPSRPTSRAGNPAASSQRIGVGPEDDRRGGRDVRVDAGTGDDGGGSPGAIGREARRGIDDVVAGDPAGRPSPDRRGGRGHGVAVDRDDVVTSIVGRRPAVIRASDAPAAEGRRPGGGDVPAEIHEQPAARGTVCRGRSQVGRERLAGRPEVELDAARNADRLGSPVELYDLPARDAHDDRRGFDVVRKGVEVAVVAEQSKGVSDRRIHRPVRHPRRPERAVDRREEQR